MDRRGFLLSGAGAAALLGGGRALAQAVPAAAVSADAAAAVRRLADLLADHYVVPAIGQAYAAMLRQGLTRGTYGAVADPAELAARLTADLQQVSPDRHLRVVPADRLPSDERARAGGAGPQPVSVAGPRPMGPPPLPAIQDAGRIAPGVAYLRFTAFPDDPAVADTVAAFMRDLAGARALIIDCRWNRGGGIKEMNAILPYLYATETRLVAMDMAESVFRRQGSPFDDERYVRPAVAPAGIVRREHVVTPTAESRWRTAQVFYLTSRSTGSAAEHLALALKRTHRATLIGEPTAGANHFGSFEPIGDGLYAFVPVGRTIDPGTGQDWEGVGVAPDVAIAPAAALEEALRRAGALG